MASFARLQLIITERCYHLPISRNIMLVSLSLTYTLEGNTYDLVCPDAGA